MTAPGILRSNPRYSSSTTGGAQPDVAEAASSSHIDGSHSAAEKSGGVTTKMPLRSLADLAKRSADLSAEATGTSDNERANIVSHRSKGQSVDDAKVVEVEESMSTLLISEQGVPYLKENAPDASGPPVVDANSVIAVGVMGEDGQQVRFCEIEDDDNTGELGGDTPSSRDRLEQRMDAGFEEDFEFDDDDDEKDDTNTDSDSDEEFDAKVLEELGLSELMRDSEGTDEDAEDYEPQSDAEELRPFRVLWELLTQRWATPATVELVLRYTGKCKPQGEESASSKSPSEGERPDDDACRNAVDIGASRVASIMSMLKMSIPRSLSELKKMHNKQSQYGIIEELDQRHVELRLADLVRTFDASAPAANLNMKMWRGLTTILIAIAFPSLGSDSADDALLPPSIRPLKLSAEEYRYLTRSAIASLSSTE